MTHPKMKMTILTLTTLTTCRLSLFLDAALVLGHKIFPALVADL